MPEESISWAPSIWIYLPTQTVQSHSPTKCELHQHQHHPNPVHNPGVGPFCQQSVSGFAVIRAAPYTAVGNAALAKSVEMRLPHVAPCLWALYTGRAPTTGPCMAYALRTSSQYRVNTNTHTARAYWAAKQEQWHQHRQPLLLAWSACRTSLLILPPRSHAPALLTATATASFLQLPTAPSLPPLPQSVFAVPLSPAPASLTSACLVTAAS
jgi:hypothetical protein